jgi:pyridoxamine 5'-phosphate oxidase
MQYTRNSGLEASQLDPDPLVQFERWLAEAKSAGLVEPTAMGLATVDAEGRPSLRMVLFKGMVGDGFSFYTNYDSRKGRELDARPIAALTFWWDRQERQIRIEGRVERVAGELSDHYFHARPRGSQLSASASRQSQVIVDRGSPRR